MKIQVAYHVQADAKRLAARATASATNTNPGTLLAGSPVSISSTVFLLSWAFETDGLVVTTGGEEGDQNDG